MIKRSKLLKDSFNAFLLDGAIFCGKLEIPLIKQNKNIKPPTKLESIRRVGSKYSDYNSCVHFYEYDYIFDSKFGVWNKIIYNLKNKKRNTNNGVAKLFCNYFTGLLYLLRYAIDYANVECL